MRIGYKHSEETRRKIAQAKKGKKFTEEHIKNLSLSHLGQKGYWTGKKRGKMSEETKEKIRLSNKGKHYFNNNPRCGEKNNKWKGDYVGYDALHDWVKRKKGTPTKCEHCNNSNLKYRQYHWSNISGEYKRNLKDWQRLCVSCHKKYDLNRIKNVKNKK